MIKVVIDTNVLVSGILKPGGWEAAVLNLIADRKLAWCTGGSSVFDIAQIIARVFPAFKSFVISVEKSDPAAGFSFTSGPYPRDSLTYKSNRVVEFKTPAQTDGLGTYSWLKKNGSPIEGVAMLVGETPDLVLLSVRLPAALNGLTPTIIRQFERDAERDDLK